MCLFIGLKSGELGRYSGIVKFGDLMTALQIKEYKCYQGNNITHITAKQKVFCGLDFVLKITPVEAKPYILPNALCKVEIVFPRVIYLDKICGSGTCVFEVPFGYLKYGFYGEFNVYDFRAILDPETVHTQFRFDEIEHLITTPRLPIFEDLIESTGENNNK